ncbi:hypothetical protein E5288_WYG017208 [Bos mutus]|uniref:Uncharacterized protein n=1 Tax=Bos mutus TaxID=72004 RepID=A0A6B0RFV5_9CETA|nr:hypothetical protein [Bos mutus]
MRGASDVKNIFQQQRQLDLLTITSPGEKRLFSGSNLFKRRFVSHKCAVLYVGYICAVLTTGTPIMSVQQHCVDTIQQTSQCLKNVGLKTIQNSQSRVSKMRELGPNIHQRIIAQLFQTCISPYV